MEVKSHTFIVTGGASGLGAAVAKKLVSLGGRVGVFDLNEDLGLRFEKENPGNIKFLKTNVADEESVQASVNELCAKWPDLRGAVNCAGVGFPEKTLSKEGEPHSLKTFLKTIQVNLIGSFNVARLAAQKMARLEPLSGGERGAIVNTASVAAFDGQMGQVAYSASKGGVVGMTLPMARDLSQLGIRVMTVAPGIFDTPMLAGLPDKVKDSLGQQVPFPPRLGLPSEYADLVAHILQNQMLNAEVIRLDGGIRMAPR